MGAIVWSELFPTKLSVFIFLSYMSLFISQGILVTASQETNNGYKYNTITVVLLTEILKLIVSTCLYCRENTFKSLIVNVVKDRKVLLLYFVPAFLYCFYNNLAFVNLSAFDPTTYYLLLQFRVVITGVLFQIIFKKYLGQKQWISLILLTFGCMIKQIDFGQGENVYAINNESIKSNGEISSSSAPIVLSAISGKNTVGIDFSINAIFILIQTICSCLAGVYNEYLLKNRGADVNIYVQNVFMYLDSIVCNLFILLIVEGSFTDVFSATSLSAIYQWNVLLIMINNAVIGIITSFFLKYLNSILKTFASALELLFTAILCYVLFSIPIYLNTMLSIAVVSLAIYMYSQNPVNNSQTLVIEKRKLLIDDLEKN